jgi:hypothetical protein
LEFEKTSSMELVLQNDALAAGYTIVLALISCYYEVASFVEMSRGQKGGPSHRCPRRHS